MEDFTSLNYDNIDQADVTELTGDDFIPFLDADPDIKLPADYKQIQITNMNSSDGIMLSNYEDDGNMFGSGGPSWYPFPGTKYFYSFLWG